MARETNNRQQQSRDDEARQQSRAEADRTEPGERSGETAKDINVVRGDDRPQTVRHSA